jgi:hypothetical protein
LSWLHLTSHPDFHVYSTLLCHERDEAYKTVVIVTVCDACEVHAKVEE